MLFLYILQDPSRHFTFRYIFNSKEDNPVISPCSESITEVVVSRLQEKVRQFLLTSFAGDKFTLHASLVIFLVCCPWWWFSGDAVLSPTITSFSADIYSQCFSCSSCGWIFVLSFTIKIVLPHTPISNCFLFLAWFVSYFSIPNLVLFRMGWVVAWCDQHSLNLFFFSCNQQLHVGGVGVCGTIETWAWDHELHAFCGTVEGDQNRYSLWDHQLHADVVGVRGTV